MSSGLSTTNINTTSNLNWIYGKSPKSLDKGLEYTRKVSKFAKKFFLSLAVVSSLLCCSYAVASVSSPVYYYKAGNALVIALMSFTFVGIFSTLEKNSKIFKDYIYQSNTFPDITSPSKLLVAEIINLPPEVADLVKKYKNDCQPFLDTVIQKFCHSQAQNPTMDIKAIMKPFQEKLYNDIQPSFEIFYSNFIVNYAYPTYVNYSKKNHLEVLDIENYKTALHIALEDTHEARMIRSLQETVENPLDVQRSAERYFLELDAQAARNTSTDFLVS